MIVDPGPALRALVLSDATVVSIAGQRMFPMKMPQGERRASLVFQEISAIGGHTLEGPAGLADMRMQITAWAETRDTAVELANALKEAIDGFANVVLYGDDSPQDQLLFKAIFFDSGGSSYDPDADMYGMRGDYFLRYTE